MKQVLQNLKTGELEIAEVPVPVAKPGHLLIQTRRSLISAGTERMLVSFAQSSLLGKAKQKPDKVKQVFDKIKTDGLIPTINSVFARLDEPLPLGYCNCGTVLQVGEGVEGYSVGDRVISNGPHAEIVCVPKHLCAKVPDSVNDEEAAFTVLASIGLQGIRLLKPTYGETIAVFGLGLIGLICVQLLKSNGCRVIGIDLDKNKLELARKYGAETIDAAGGADAIRSAVALSDGKGVDGVLITASAKEDSIVHQSAQMCRKRGRIVLVGVVNLNLDRTDFYEKELSFQVSCSYGPGRYDSRYEQGGQDYPYGFVRWTEQRNFESILEGFNRGTLTVKDMISRHIPQAQAQEAYQMLTDDPSCMALVLTYPTEEPQLETSIAVTPAQVTSSAVPKVVAGLIGAGNFAKLTLLPALKGATIKLKTVADIEGVSSTYAAKKFGFAKAANDYHQILDDPEINTVFITTRHDLHANMVKEALQAGKHVHVEKPLCLNREELTEIEDIYHQHSKQQLLVGFNRRFSAHAQKIKSLVQSRSAPMCMTWLINAGHIPADVWIQNRAIGGGRMIGEGCHWLDFMAFIAGSSIVSVNAAMINAAPGVEVTDDKMTVTVNLADGSIGTLHYFANGHKSFPKETLEVFCDGNILHLNNFRKLRGFGWSHFKKMNLFSQDKGHKAQFHRFIECIQSGGKPLIAFDQIKNATLASYAALESAQQGKQITL